MLEPNPLSVLVVDDDRLILACMARVLRRHHIRATCVASPFGVSALVLQQAPDVLVLDCHMPGLDGAGLARLLRAKPRTAATRVVFYSGDSEANLAALAAGVGAEYACKGAGFLPLLDAISRAMSSAPSCRSWSAPASPQSRQSVLTLA